MKRITFTFLLVILLIGQSFGQKRKPNPATYLQAGPMVGYCEMREVMLWVQTRIPATVHIEYQAQNPKGPVFKTNAYNTTEEEAYAAHLLANKVQPGLTYDYTLFINGSPVKRPYPTTFQTPPNWKYREEPPTMKIALGSCSYINDSIYDRKGKPYGGDPVIYTSIHEKRPDMMLWLGDNVYSREPDWWTRTGWYHRYSHSRKTEEMQALLGSTAHYAVWDDHDYGPNNSDRSYRAKDIAWETFQHFWANPSYGVNGKKGVTTSFVWGDAEFFLLDNRYFRDPNDKKTQTRSILGEEQLQWLIDALISSTSKFKFVCMGGQLINTVDKYENYANIAPAERQYILNTIATEGIKNVIFLTGDRHHSELSKYEKNGITIYDFTVSSLTARAYDAEKEPNALRVPGSQVGQHNFGIMTIEGPRKERTLVLEIFDKTGKSLWKYEVAVEQ
ncbi:MAG: alkaline phosphatase D family protein [Bacteroidota bacterium]